MGPEGTAVLLPLCVMGGLEGRLPLVCKTRVWGSARPAVILSLMESSCGPHRPLVPAFDVCERPLGRRGVGEEPHGCWPPRTPPVGFLLTAALQWAFRGIWSWPETLSCKTLVFFSSPVFKYSPRLSVEFLLFREFLLILFPPY